MVYDLLENGLRVKVTPKGECFYGTLVQGADSARWTSLDGKETRSFAVSTPVRMERRVPDLDYITECDNRVWGCSSRENVIYACKLGDFRNWNSFAGLSTDSYAAAREAVHPLQVLQQVQEDNIFVTEEQWERINGKAVVNTETVDSVSDTLTNASLKLNGVSDGMISYNRVVELLLQWYGEKEEF